MMTGTHQRWARARRAFGGPDASGVELDPNSCFMGCPHTVFGSASGARGLPNRCERKQPFVLRPRTERLSGRAAPGLIGLHSAILVARLQGSRDFSKQP